MSSCVTMVLIPLSCCLLLVGSPRLLTYSCICDCHSVQPGSLEKASPCAPYPPRGAATQLLMGPNAPFACLWLREAVGACLAQVRLLTCCCFCPHALHASHKSACGGMFFATNALAHPPPGSPLRTLRRTGTR
jgi:hypothetical protein